MGNNWSLCQRQKNGLESKSSKNEKPRCGLVEIDNEIKLKKPPPNQENKSLRETKSLFTKKSQKRSRSVDRKPRPIIVPINIHISDFNSEMRKETEDISIMSMKRNKTQKFLGERSLSELRMRQTLITHHDYEY